MVKKALVCGGGGFIGSHLVEHLKNEGYNITAADLKLPEYHKSTADHFEIIDLRIAGATSALLSEGYDEVYQLAADMGGAGYIFTGVNDADIMRNNILININVLDAASIHNVSKIFYTSSACIYPEYNQLDPNNPNCEEDTAYPADPDSEYGWEKLFSERLYSTYQRNRGIETRIARLHNVFGPMGSWDNGKEKAPAAICRKIAASTGEIDIWGTGEQTRSFLYIDECIEGIVRIMQSDCSIPLNLGSERMISINDLALLIAKLAGKEISINHIPGPVGVMGRTSSNKKILETVGWAPSDNLEEGLLKTYRWIESQL
jgi:nucleoside-diphosphate-sugar epimerase